MNTFGKGQMRAAGGRDRSSDPVPLEYSIEWLTCVVASRLDAVTVIGRMLLARLEAIRHVLSGADPTCREQRRAFLTGELTAVLWREHSQPGQLTLCASCARVVCLAPHLRPATS